ncbi:MAG: DUF1186 domain-containing protein [Bacteroidetes bacterium]|nr:DUF1186 domain-containing protein [Bacteroidota bacterium]
MNKVDLNFPQLLSLYTNGMRIDQSVIQEILELPSKPLIEDLESIIKSSIEYFEFYKTRNLPEFKKCFPIHAIFLLSELKSESSLYIILAFLSRSKEFLNFWCGKYSKELVWESVYTLGNSSTKFLQKYLLSQINSEETNRVILKAISQIALHQPSRRNEIINWYSEVLKQIMSLSYADYHYPYDLAAIVVAGILDFKGVELFNEVRILFDAGKVNKFICGDIEDFTTELRIEKESDFKSKLFDIYERYDFILNTQMYYNKMEDLKEIFRYKRRTLVKN